MTCRTEEKTALRNHHHAAGNSKGSHQHHHDARGRSSKTAITVSLACLIVLLQRVSIHTHSASIENAGNTRSTVRHMAHYRCGGVWYNAAGRRGFDNGGVWSITGRRRSFTGRRRSFTGRRGFHNGGVWSITGRRRSFTGRRGFHNGGVWSIAGRRRSFTGRRSCCTRSTVLRAHTYHSTHKTHQQGQQTPLLQTGERLLARHDRKGESWTRVGSWSG